ncbi:alpha/beta fold hydrolase [Halobacillus sp. Nhm2S1]|uniref:alpha/beta fold hydrolase n=1 Tax=Halobacillus sp. Nhm2S1 TaxID=2866716 RepID=UPI001C73CFAB|nr:alpha/beta hydrolase [Halobacillus sp. Nhm2S1]MBX0358501.1 alpha/beta hydrolase [Halobacillus sp. Nhm2S1]
MSWKQTMVETARGTFEVFEKGQESPLAVTHLYSEFNVTGDYFAEAFVESHTVYLINLKECGRTDKASSPHELTMLESVLDLEAIRKALGFECWSFAGHSTGGMLAVVYGIYFSESLETLVIANAAAREYMTFSEDCIYNEAHPEFDHMQSLIEQLKNQDLSEERRRELTVERTKLSLWKPQHYEHYFNRPIVKKMSAVRMNFFARELHTFDVTRKLGLITVKTLVISGKHDVQCPPSYSEEIVESVPGAIHLRFHQSNHYPHLEEEQKFNQVIRAHFD